MSRFYGQICGTFKVPKWQRKGFFQMKTIKLLLVVSALTSLNLYANTHDQDVSKNTFCLESPQAQIRGGLIYRPNTTEPYSGKSSCAYSINGQLSMKGQIKQGRLNGEWLEWYVNGQIKSKGFFKDGLPNGVYTKWHNNGQKQFEGEWSDNVKIGQWHYWYQDGQLAQSDVYREGKKQQASLFWDKNGNPINLPPIHMVKTGWIIKLASFKSRESAQSLIHKLYYESYPAHIEEYDSNYRVFVGPYDTRSIAQDIETDLKQKVRLSGIITKRYTEEDKKHEEKLAAEAKAAADAKALNSAAVYIRDEISKHWKRPLDARNGMYVEVLVRLVPTGEVISVEVVARDATDAMVASVKRAILKVRRFDKLMELDSEVFEANFRKFRLRFKPEDLWL